MFFDLPHSNSLSATVLIGVLAMSASAAAGPSVGGVSANQVSHGDVVTVTGAAFGQKVNPAPLVWDDASGSNIRALWSGGWPNSSTNPEFNIQYTAPIRGIAPPHSRTNRYLAGAHGENAGAYAGWNVMVFKTINVTTYPFYIYASWYQRADDNWVFGGDNNFKMFNYSMGNEPYAAYNSWMLIWGPPHPDNTGDSCQWAIGDDGKSLANPDVNGNTAWWGRGVNPMSGVWSKIEVAAKVTPTADGYVNVWEDGVQRVAYAGATDKMAGSNRTIGIGGFARMVGKPTNYRYFTDIYVDTSLARVVLANNSSLKNATVVESQIPQAWSDGAVTFKVNLGRFANGQKAYLFVIDASGNVSAPSAVTVSDTGVPVVIPQMAKPKSPSLSVH